MRSYLLAEVDSAAALAVVLAQRTLWLKAAKRPADALSRGREHLMRKELEQRSGKCRDFEQTITSLSLCINCKLSSQADSTFQISYFMLPIHLLAVMAEHQLQLPPLQWHLHRKHAPTHIHNRSLLQECAGHNKPSFNPRAVLGCRLGNKQYKLPWLASQQPSAGPPVRSQGVVVP